MIFSKMQLSTNFHLNELTASETAKAQDIKNTPNADQIHNLRLLTIHVLQPIRSFLNRPVKVNSGFRSEELNEAVGGVSNSFHKQGLAADVEVEGISASTLSQMIEKTDLPIEENYEDTGHVHLALDTKEI